MKSFAKSWFFLALISVTLIVLGHFYFGREGLLFGLVFSLGINTFIYFYEDRRIYNLIGGLSVEGQDSYELHDIIRRLAIRARIVPPKLSIIPIGSPQAAVIGSSSTRSTILLTQGALDKFSKAELEAIVAYQIASIQSLNTFAFSIGSFLVTLLLLAAETGDAIIRILIVEKKNPSVVVSQLLTRLVSPIAGFILRIAVRPSLYKNADTIASQLIGDNSRIVQVLWKLESYARTMPITVSLATAHTFIVSPLTKNPWTFRFKTQPSSASRIKALVGHYPI